MGQTGVQDIPDGEITAGDEDHAADIAVVDGPQDIRQGLLPVAQAGADGLDAKLRQGVVELNQQSPVIVVDLGVDHDAHFFIPAAEGDGGRYPLSSSADSTICRVVSATLGSLFSTRDTVAVETPHHWAIIWMDTSFLWAINSPPCLLYHTTAGPECKFTMRSKNIQFASVKIVYLSKVLRILKKRLQFP